MLGQLAAEISNNTSELFEKANITHESLRGISGNVKGMNMAAQFLPIQPEMMGSAPVMSFKPQQPSHRFG
jgi:hypothetical protein